MHHMSFSKNFLSSISSMMPSTESKSTVDAKEVDFFSNPAHFSWNENDPLLTLNTVRIPFIKDGILNLNTYTNTEVSANNPDTKFEEVLKGLKILDVGCGGGYLSECLAELGADVTGIDASSKAIETAKKHAAQSSITKKIRYIVSSMEDHKGGHKDYYDAVIASEIIEHVANPELFVESCVTALKPGGSIFITTPGKTFFSRLYVIYLAEYVFGSIPKGTHDYDKFISPDELQQMLKKNYCKTMQNRGMFYNILTRTWSFSSYEGLFYASHAVKSR